MSTITLRILVSEENTDSDRIEWLTQSLMKQLYDMDVDNISRLREGNLPRGAKGDPLTIGAIALAITVAGLPSLISFIQNWITDTRKVSIEVPNGTRVEFVAEKKYSQDEIIALVKKLNQISS
ncbi:MAG: hypothetical protein R3C14_50670 [Caldilineaceae bacterium]